MKQQINLYQARFQPPRVVLPLMLIAALGGALVLLLAVVSGLEVAGQRQLQADVSGLEVLQRELTLQLKQLEAQAARLAPNRLLEVKVQKLTREAGSRQRVLEHLRSGAVNTEGGFSPHLAGLARQHLQGTWLTRLDIRPSGRDLALGGRALRADLVPTYLRQLGNEPVFQGIGLQVMNLKRPAGEASPVLFELRTRLQEETP